MIALGPLLQVLLDVMQRLNLEVPALEVVLGSALQLLGNRTHDHGLIRFGATKLAAMPDQPSMPEVCDRPRLPP